MWLGTAYIFYADTYFMQNFLMKLVALMLALWSNKVYAQVSQYKIITFCGLGTIVEMILLMSGIKSFAIALYSLIEIPIILYLTLKKEKRLIIRVSITSLFFVILLNGFLEVLWNWFGKYMPFGLLVTTTCLIGSILIRRIFLYIKSKKGIYPLVILHNGIEVRGYGLYDTGNCLKDVYTGYGVHIISAQIGEKLQLSKEKAVLIPYKVLGKEDLLKVYYIEQMQVFDNNHQKIEKPVAVGWSEDRLFSGKNYNVILNENIW